MGWSVQLLACDSECPALPWNGRSWKGFSSPWKAFLKGDSELCRAWVSHWLEVDPLNCFWLWLHPDTNLSQLLWLWLALGIGLWIAPCHTYTESLTSSSTYRRSAWISAFWSVVISRKRWTDCDHSSFHCFVELWNTQVCPIYYRFERGKYVECQRSNLLQIRVIHGMPDLTSSSRSRKKFLAKKRVTEQEKVWRWWDSNPRSQIRSLMLFL